MTEIVHIENVVLGGGEAGKYMAWDLAQQGRAVVVIERALVGGVSERRLLAEQERDPKCQGRRSDRPRLVVWRVNRGSHCGHEGCPSG